MRFFSPTAFGSLYLSFNLDKSKTIPSDFVDSLLNSPSSGQFQRLHFYVHQRKINLSGLVIKKLLAAIEKSSDLIKSRPWCENLLPYLEIPNHPEIVHSNAEMIIVKDRFPKVIN